MTSVAGAIIYQALSYILLPLPRTTLNEPQYDGIRSIRWCPCSISILLGTKVTPVKSTFTPGPPRWPIIGSALSLPRSEQNWKSFARWGQEFKSDVIYLPVMGDNLVILNSYEATTELFERRSALYSGRPRFVMARELVGWNQVTGLLSYGHDFRRTRRLLHDGLGPKSIQTWQPRLEREALKFIQRLLSTPEDFIAHIRQNAGATVIEITYGYSVHDKSDEFITAAEQAMESVSALITPGASIVDMIPWLRYIPWTPFKRLAAESKKHVVALADTPMEYVHAQMRKGGKSSLVSKWLENPSGEKDYESIVKWAAASLYLGGTDTTVSSMLTFVVAMLYNPLVQTKAQLEISQLLQDRLPTFEDREQLPYVEAIYKEVLRWQPVGPLGIPHVYAANQDDEYKGMRIPAGSMVISNLWAMLHNPSTYKDPEQFKPERFLGANPERNPEDMAFGFGRRHPAPFKCNITPRSDRIKHIVEEALV
ncbi:cytochrome P450 family protein [Ceratobasidium sp. AG-Ba]|nr:cytochrome P450 family protein [Ceratobasidium sp. AG-Ba]